MKCFSLGTKSATIKSHCLNTVAHFRSNLNYCIHYKTVKKYDILYNLPYRVVSISSINWKKELSYINSNLQ